MAAPTRRAVGLVADDEEESGTAAELIPAEASLDELAAVAAGCTACHLHEHATQTVFGEGPASARLVVVGEQPGDREDIEGAPFVGPAGGEFDRALDEVAIARDEVYVTNAVKHFKFHRQRKRRIHDKPNNIEIRACLPWLRAEVDRLEPDVVLGLGATASKALLGSSFRVTKERGDLYPGVRGSLVTGTVHPSSILRAPDSDSRRQARTDFHDDLEAIAVLLRDGLPAALHRRTRAHLYERARAFDVAGRSTMDKGELADAVAEALRRQAA